MASWDNIRAVPLLGLALAGGLVIGLVSAFASGGSLAVPTGRTPAVVAPAVPPSRSLRWVVREQRAPAEQRVARRDAPAHSAPIRRISSTAVYYSGCREVRAAGAAPLYAGEPGYRVEMDGDRDGIACEPYRGQ